jgi:hypothetical protein
MISNVTNQPSTGTNLHREPDIGITDEKTYSLARKIFEGLGLILANVFTLGFINIFKCVRDEYRPVFTNDQKSVSSLESVMPRELTYFEKQIFPCSDSDNPKTLQKFTPEMRNMLDDLFGLHDVVSKMPTCDKKIQIERDWLKEFNPEQPVMKALSTQGEPLIIISLKPASEEQMRNEILPLFRFADVPAPEAYIEKAMKKKAIIILEPGNTDPIEVGIVKFFDKYQVPLLWGGGNNIDHQVLKKYSDAKNQFIRMIAENAECKDANEKQWVLAID